ncbi:MAG: biotin carboxylase N-terminal domain-containing protein, partial [Rhodococcus sp. (in: high G+C Gram-positive bacteria)]
MTLLPDLVALVCLETVDRVPILVREHRGEIAIRAFRAAYELGAGTVAVFPYEDRNSIHRLKA